MRCCCKREGAVKPPPEIPPLLPLLCLGPDGTKHMSAFVAGEARCVRPFPPGSQHSAPRECHFPSRDTAGTLRDAGALGGQCPAPHTCLCLPSSLRQPSPCRSVTDLLRLGPVLPAQLRASRDSRGAATAAHGRASNKLLYDEFTTTDHLVLE